MNLCFLEGVLKFMASPVCPGGRCELWQCPSGVQTRRFWAPTVSINTATEQPELRQSTSGLQTGRFVPPTVIINMSTKQKSHLETSSMWESKHTMATGYKINQKATLGCKINQNHAASFGAGHPRGLRISFLILGEVGYRNCKQNFAQWT